MIIHHILFLVKDFLKKFYFILTFGKLQINIISVANYKSRNKMHNGGQT